MTLPDNTVYKEYYGSGWQSGLTTITKSYATVTDANADSDQSSTCSAYSPSWKKKTIAGYTQDNTGISYQTNPRVIETNICDASGNRRRTTIDYNSVAVGTTAYHLPETVREYAADGATILRRSVTLYGWDSSLTSRHVIGLVTRQQVYEGESTLVSMEDYIYDWVAGYMDGTAPAVHHDTANYGPVSAPVAAFWWLSFATT